MALTHIRPAGQAGFVDRFDHRASQWLRAWDPLRTFQVGLVGAPLSKTSISHSGAFQFPQSVRAALAAYDTYSIDADLDIADVLTAADVGDIALHPTDLRLCHQRIGEALHSYWSSAPNSVLFLVGGDHSITAPSLSALAQAVGGTIGVIHFDAHHDMRNLEDGGPTNGTPFRSLLDSGVLQGERLVQIGLRNFANARAYTEYARAHGVTLFTARQVARLGIADVLAHAWDIAAKGADRVYVSFDMDVLDQAYAPGVPAPGPGGLTIFDALDAMNWLGRQPKVCAFDWVCADPTVDVRNLTARVAANLLLQAAVGLAERNARTGSPE